MLHQIENDFMVDLEKVTEKLESEAQELNLLKTKSTKLPF